MKYLHDHRETYTMQYRKMGERIPWKGSALGFGCMRLPRKKVLFWQTLDKPSAIELIRYGIDLGINYIDTAWGYHGGKSEYVVGEALKDGYREKVHLVTKLPIWKVKTEDDFDVYLHKQLKRLQTDHLDIYLFHALNKKRFEKVKRLNLIKKMEKAREEGLIDHIGFSFHDSYQVFRNIIDYYDWDMCQVQFNYFDENYQATYEGIKYAASKGIAVVIMEPLRGGALANPGEEVKKIIEKAPVKRSPVEWALHYLWTKPEISVVLSGMGSRQMVEENCAAADRSGIDSLTPEEKQVIESMADVYRRKLIVPCTGCGYCMEDGGCPEGVNIPENFSILNRLSLEGNLEKKQKQYNKLKSNGEDATHCVECRACVPRCPQNIDIPTELKKVVAVFEEHKPITEFQH